MTDQLAAVMAVLALMGGLAWCAHWAKGRGFAGTLAWRKWANVAGDRGGIRTPKAPLRVTARLPLTHQHCLHRVETAEGGVYLLVTHAAGVTVLASGEPMEETVES